ncbi:MAG: nuclear transport factor 2 family protein [Chitinophagaceae bacterium]
MQKISFCLTLITFYFPSIAQTQQDRVTNAVKNYVDAFYYGDTSKIHQSIATSVVKYGYYMPKGKASYEGEPMSFKEMIDYAAGVKKRGISPNVEKFPKKIEVFDVLDQTASAKLTAWWGTDYLLLARLNDHWMITHVLWQSPPPKN